VRGHDHRAPDRDHVRRRLAVAADPGGEGARELTRRGVPPHTPYLVPTRFERFGLELGVLDDGAPERPRERHHDADLHAVSLEHRASRRQKLDRAYSLHGLDRPRDTETSARRPSCASKAFIT